MKTNMIGRYVIVRCRDAGVHCGVLESHRGRECVLTNSRRIYDWTPTTGKSLSGVANHGVLPDSKVAEPVQQIILTENCEIILCSQEAEESLKKIPVND